MLLTSIFSFYHKWSDFPMKGWNHCGTSRKFLPCHLILNGSFRWFLRLSIYKTSRDPVYIVLFKPRIIAWNSELLSIYGWSKVRALERSDGNLNLQVLFQTLHCGYSLVSSLREDSIEYPQHRVWCTDCDILYFEIAFLALTSYCVCWMVSGNKYSTIATKPPCYDIFIGKLS